MNNGNMPANAIFNDEGFPTHEGHVDGEEFCSGLTKREHFAGLAMQGFLSNRLEVPSTGGKTLVDFIARCSIDYADALLKELDK